MKIPTLLQISMNKKRAAILLRMTALSYLGIGLPCIYIHTSGPPSPIPEIAMAPATTLIESQVLGLF